MYDLHRQRILESYGFVFYRIWSTNWWKDPDTETYKLISFIREQESKNLYPHEGFVDSFYFEDDLGQDNYEYDSYEDGPKLLEPVKEEEFEKMLDSEVVVFESAIQLHSRVEVRMMNNRSLLKVKIVREVKADQSRVDAFGFTLVSESAKLAVALLGKKKGDMVEVNGNTGEVLSVLN